MPWVPTSLPPTAAHGRTPDWVPVELGGHAILMIRLDDGWWAVEDRCSHAGCAFSDDGELDGSTIICGCHGSEFEVRTGAVVRSPADHPIATFPTRLAGDVVEVDLP